jgi:hypothetical protein
MLLQEYHLGRLRSIPVFLIKDPDIVATFRFRHYLSLAVVMVAAYLPAIFLIQSQIGKTLFFEHTWLIALLLCLLLIVIVIVNCNLFKARQRVHQVTILFFAIVLITGILCLLSALFDTTSFAKGALLSACYMVAIAFYCLQTRLGINKCGMVLFLVLFLGGILFVVVYWPYRDMWDKHNLDDVLHPPPSVWGILVTVGVSVAVSGVFIWASMENEYKVTPDDYLYSTFLVFVSISTLIILVGKDYCWQSVCSSTPSISNGSGMSVKDLQTIKTQLI